MNISNEYQPEPIHNDKLATWELVIFEYDDELSTIDYIKEEVINIFKERDEFGRNKHGTPLQPFNGRDSLFDALQENLDLIVYLRNAVEESTDDWKTKSNLWSCYLIAVNSFENLYMIYKQSYHTSA